jgi:hypothetical protein
MTNLFLDKLDAAPLDNDDFSYPFNAWCANNIDSTNEIINDIQNQFNGIGVPYGPTRLTQAQILNLDGLGKLSDGVFIYCTDHGGNPCYVGRINGALVQFQTIAFP